MPPFLECHNKTTQSCLLFPPIGPFTYAPHNTNYVKSTLKIIPLMNKLLCALLIHFSILFHGHCTTDNLHLGAQTTLVIPGLYIIGFVTRAFVLETSQPVPNFRAGLTVEAVEGRYVCSFDVFLGEFKVWSSGHLSRFFTSEKCVVWLTGDGDLLLTGRDGMLGWRTATFGQGIKRLQLSNSGNLVLVDEFNIIKWQSFHFPTNVMLWGQTLDAATKLTTNSASFNYSFEIRREKLALYLNSGNFKYSYWEFNPKDDQEISFIRLATNGLQILDDKNHKIAQIPSKRLQLLRFLAIDNTTGNLAFYYYSTTTRNFEASFEAIRNECDEPNFCKVGEICTFGQKCSVLELEGYSGNFCGGSRGEMRAIRNKTSGLRDENKRIKNVTKERCEGLCIEECTCVGAMFVSETRECYLYGEIRGMKEVNSVGENVSFMVKVLESGKKGNGLKKWALVLIVVVDGIFLFVCLGGMGFYMVWKRRKEGNDN